jgi:hypothetical protein
MTDQLTIPVSPTTITPGNTVGEARTWLQDRLPDGTRCPVCHQHAKVYRRKMNSGMARVLILMYRAAGLGWQKTRGIDNSGTIAKCAYWGLVEPGRRGTWRVTEAGARFVNGLYLVPSHVEVYDGRLLRMDPTTLVTIWDALGDDFDYQELMDTPATLSVRL